MDLRSMRGAKAAALNLGTRLKPAEHDPDNSRVKRCRMPYWRLYYHLVWSTYRREPLIDEISADLLQRALRKSCQDLQIMTHAIGSMPDHVHLAVSIPPTLAVTDAIARLKR